MLMCKCSVERLCHLAHPFFVHLANSAIIGQKSVGFVLNITDLCINGRTKSLINCRNNLITVKRNQILLKGGGIGVLAIAISLVEIEGMLGELKRIAAELGEYHRTPLDGLKLDGFEVDVIAFHVTPFVLEPTRGGVPHAGGIECPEVIVNIVRVKLSPTLVEDGVIADAGMTVNSAELQYVPNNYVPVEGENAEKLEKLLSAVDDLDDVTNVYTNAE